MNFQKNCYYLVKVVPMLVVLSACSTAPPADIDNLCRVFEQKGGWHKFAQRSEKRWGVPISVLMATVHQESRFRAKAKPPRRKVLGFIPGPRPSSAYGYAQAIDETWQRYSREVGNRGADRDKFKDAIDFIGWYHAKTVTDLGVPAHDAYHLYLAYHQGHGGFSRGSYQSKHWLKKVAKKVSVRARGFQNQYNSCHAELEKGWWPF